MSLTCTLMGTWRWTTRGDEPGFRLGEEEEEEVDEEEEDLLLLLLLLPFPECMTGICRTIGGDSDRFSVVKIR